MRVAYLVNQYPKVSHSFIRREILALEAQGVSVTRVALRGWDAPLVDGDDQAEQNNTLYLLKNGVRGLLQPTWEMGRRSPIKLLKAFWRAFLLSTGSDKHVGYHLAYVLEACKFVKICQEHSIAHAHAHFGSNGTEVLLQAKLLGGPSYSFTVHGPEEFDNPKGLHLADKIAGSAFTVAISSFGRSQLMRWVDQEHWQKIAVVHCGLDAKYLQPPQLTTPNLRRFVCVGRLCEQKGQLLLLDAAQQLQAEGIEFQLLLAGDGEMRSVVEDRIRSAGLQDTVTITGWLSANEVLEQLLAARALVLPSFAEGLPVVIMEAMALSRPVITTYIAGIPELVQHQEHGWLLPAGDVNALAEAMKACLEAPIAECEQMGSAARQRVLQRHNVNEEAKKLALLFGRATSEVTSELGEP